MEKILVFLSEYGELLFIGLPVLALLVILFGIFIKMFVKNPKSMLGALFTVIGVIALYMAVCFAVEEKHWEKAAMVFLAAGPTIYCFYCNPKRMLKIVLIALSIVAGLVGIGLIFNFAIAVAVGANGFFIVMTIFPAKRLKECIRIEKNGIRTEGEILSFRLCRGGKIPTFGFTTEDGTYIKQEIGDIWASRANKLHEKFTLIYDPDDPNKICAGKYTRIGLIADVVIFLAIDLVIFVFTVYLMFL